MEPEKKILIISPTPTHPQNAGNRAVIFRRAKYLQKKGYRIHFVLYNREAWSGHVKERPNLKAMKEEWDEFFILKSSFIFSKFIESILAIVGGYIKARNIFLYKILKFFVPDGFPTSLLKDKSVTYTIDQLYDVRLDSLLVDLHKKYRYHVVLVQYVFLSRALTLFDENVVKVLDTHDVFSLRSEKFRKHGLLEPFFSTTPEEEAKALNRAHIVIAIQPEEKRFFESLTNRPVIEIGHMVKIKEPQWRNTWSNYLLFVGAANTSNIDGMNFFFKEIVPLIHREISDVKILLVGQISKYITHPSAQKLGEIESLDSIYTLADVVINPVRVGTGLKIKTIEALAYSKPFVGAPESVSGLNGWAVSEKPFMVAETPEQFSQCIIQLYKDRDLYYKLSHQAHRFSLAYNERIKKAYDLVF